MSACLARPMDSMLSSVSMRACCILREYSSRWAPSPPPTARDDSLVMLSKRSLSFGWVEKKNGSWMSSVLTSRIRCSNTLGDSRTS